MTATIEHELETPDEIAIFRKQDAIVADLREKYMGLKINGLNDRKGFDAVHDGRMVVKRARVDVEKTRVKLKEDVLARGRKIDAEAKRVTALLAPIEEHLEAEENAVIQERERIKAEAEATRKAKVQARYTALQSVGYTGNMMAVPEMSDDDFAATLEAATAAKAERDRAAQAEQERLRRLEAEAAERRRQEELAAAEKRKADEQAMAAERQRLAAEKRRQDEEAAKLKAELERVEQERRNIELERAKQEAAQKAREQAEREHAARVEREKAEAAELERLAKERAAAEEAARLKAEAERPQRDKLIKVAIAVLHIEVPDGPGHDAVCDVLTDAAERINEIAKGDLE